MNRYLSVFITALIVMVAGASSGCFSLADTGPGEFEVKEAVLSPSKTSKAYLWIGMGGGAAGWCYKRVSILPASLDFPLNREAEPNRIAYVFSSRCSSNIKVTWVDDTLMKVSYTLGDDPIPTSLSQAGRTEDGRIKIVYEILENERNNK